MIVREQIERATTARYAASSATLGIRQSFYKHLRNIRECSGEDAAIRAAEHCVDGAGPFGHSIAAREAARNLLA